MYNFHENSVPNNIKYKNWNLFFVNSKLNIVFAQN